MGMRFIIRAKVYIHCQFLSHDWPVRRLFAESVQVVFQFGFHEMAHEFR